MRFVISPNIKRRSWSANPRLGGRRARGSNAAALTIDKRILRQGWQSSKAAGVRACALDEWGLVSARRDPALLLANVLPWRSRRDCAQAAPIFDTRAQWPRVLRLREEPLARRVSRVGPTRRVRVATRAFGHRVFQVCCADGVADCAQRVARVDRLSAAASCSHGRRRHHG